MGVLKILPAFSKKMTKLFNPNQVTVNNNYITEFFKIQGKTFDVIDIALDRII